MALVPMAVCIGSLAAAGSIRLLAEKLQSSNIFLVGTALNIAMIFTFGLTKENLIWMYFLGFLAGLGISLQLSTALNMVADMISTQDCCKSLKEGAFVYAFYNVIGKVSEGVALYWIMSHESFVGGDSAFVKFVGVGLPLIGSFIGAFFIVVSYASGAFN